MGSLSHGTKLQNRIDEKKHIKEIPLLLELRTVYNRMKDAIGSLNPASPDFVRDLIDVFNVYFVVWSDPKYKKLRDNGRSKLYPSVNEELMEQLFKYEATKYGYVCGYGPVPLEVRCNPDLVKKARYFYECLDITYLDADFYIGSVKKLDEKTEIIVPSIIIENKRYPDSPMQATVMANLQAVKRFLGCYFGLVVDKASGHGGIRKELEQLGLNQMFVLKDDCVRLKDERIPYNNIKYLYDTIVKEMSGPNKQDLTFKQKCDRGHIYD